eukprot:TRINITY_DN12889_c0_g1_i1.p1 TRINITY_DN12889_c0_g1~~TRINITY_DN12889_c0_g1_i1.p1  ORF type:complete len:354 (+),score=67.85 TRINITY_DN12889_c0_g1_i1:55-1062(+)
MPDQTPKRVLITGAAGNIGYALAFKVAGGDMFGPDQKVILHLLDIERAADALKGVEAELQDCAFPLLEGIVATTDVDNAFSNITHAVFVGAFPRLAGMERKDLLKANVGIFKAQGSALDRLASKDVKCLVVGNPANTNCLILRQSAPSIPDSSFSALTRLDHNRAKTQLALRFGVPVADVHNVTIWGNHSGTQYPDVSHAYIRDPAQKVFSEGLTHEDREWLRGGFVSTVQKRGAYIIGLRKLSSAASAAQAAVDHMRDWEHGSGGEVVSMGVVSDGSYGVTKGLVFSFPVKCKSGAYSIVQGLEIDDYSQEKLNATEKELIEEKNTAEEFLGNE